jgi:GTP-binding protein
MIKILGNGNEIKSAVFVKSAVKLPDYPDESLPEIAFAGPSNVGKSSLINTLLNRKKLVKTSSTPGVTQLINFFRINEQVFLVDLPGYGFARVPAEIQREWGPMVETYLQHRANLLAVFWLLDARREPTVRDHQFGDWLRCHKIPYFVVVTKTDKLSPSRCRVQVRIIAASLNLTRERIFPFSKLSKDGRIEILKQMETVVQKWPDVSTSGAAL